MRSNPFEQLPQGFVPVVMGILCVIMIVAIVVYIIYLKNLQDLLKAVREPNRRMAPGKVWLILINFLGVFTAIPALFPDSFPGVPLIMLTVLNYAITLFVLFWNFYMVNKIAESIEAEYASRSLTPEERRPTWQLGMIMCGCNAAALLNNVPYVRILGTIAAFAGFICWIMYWVKTHSYKQKLRMLPDNDQDSMIFGNYQ